MDGLAGYPVFTRKPNTDVSYLACARRMLAATRCACIRCSPRTTRRPSPRSTTSRAGAQPTSSSSACTAWATTCTPRRSAQQHLDVPCRVYAPVGSHEDLLPYLVRRLLENGANYQLRQPHHRRVAAAGRRSSPIRSPPSRAFATKPHPNIPQPSAIFADRKNSMGVNLANDQELAALAERVNAAVKPWKAAPLVPGSARRRRRRCRSPIPPIAARPSATGSRPTPAQVEQALANAQAAFNDWDHLPAASRAKHARARRRPDGSAHARADRAVREGSRQVAVAPRSPKCARRWISAATTRSRARKLFGQPEKLPGPTGESNELQLHGRGVFVVHQPVEFPAGDLHGPGRRRARRRQHGDRQAGRADQPDRALRGEAAARSRRAGRRAAVRCPATAPRSAPR